MSAVVARSERERIPTSIVVVTALAWVLSIAGEVSGRASLLGHRHLIEGGLPPVAAIALFVLAWQVMLAAMMLPSSVSMLRAFDRIVAARPDRLALRASFLGGYVAVWTAFGLVAFGGDSMLHRTVDSSPWLQQHEWLIGAAVLIGAGAFQFSSLKERCLTECRTPVGFLMERYRPGAAAASRTGLAHGVFCIGCCWALMLVAFAAGAGNLVWMAILTTVMVVERTVSWGASLVRPVGTWLILLGVLML